MNAAKLANMRLIVAKLLRRKAFGRLQKVLAKTHVADVAEIMRFVSSRDRRQMLDLMPDRDARAELLSELADTYVAELCAGMEDGVLVDLLARMPSDDAADVLGLLDEARAEELLRKMRGDDSVEGLLRYDEETAGGIMSTDLFALPEDTTAAEAIARLQSAADVEMVFYIYVVNEHGHLVGVLSLRQLVVCGPETRLKDVMETDVFSVRATEDREDVARMVARYNILAVPVVDEANKLLGIVTVDDVIDVIREEATEDFLKMAGAGDEELFEEPSIQRSARTRMPWLAFPGIGGLVAATVVAGFEQAIVQVAGLAAFIPIVMGMGGNVGTQSSTIIVRGIALGRVDVHRFARTVGRELAIGLVLGVVYGGLLGALAGALFHGDASPVALGATVALALCANMSLAALVGAGLPLALHRLNIDPAVATGPFVTTAIDVVGLVVFFLIALGLHPSLSLGALA